jgi:hypothetical protein
LSLAVTSGLRRRNYKGSGSFVGRLGLSRGSVAHWLTLSARQDRVAAAAERYAERREILETGRLARFLLCDRAEQGSREELL